MGRIPKLFVLLAFSAGLSTGGFEIEEAEYKCESAVAHLDECCDDFVPSNYACYQDGCRDVDADIPIPQADCIRKKSCDDLKTEGFCTATRVESVACY